MTSHNAVCCGDELTGSVYEVDVAKSCCGHEYTHSDRTVCCVSSTKTYKVDFYTTSMSLSDGVLGDHCVSITSHYSNEFSYRLICGCSLHELMVAVLFDVTVPQPPMKSRFE